MDKRSDSEENPFQNIYRTAAWGRNENETRSGPGSMISRTAQLRAWLETLIQVFEIESMLDAACGEWGWMSQVDLGSCRYTGIDVVPEAVESNCTRFPDQEFLLGDIAHDPLPKADLVMCKDCFQHLSTEAIRLALENIRQSGALFLLTSSDFHPPPLTNQNRTVKDGGYSPENLHAEPLNLRKWIGNVSLDRKTFSLWCLREDSPISHYRELFSTCALTAFPPLHLDSSLLADTTVVYPNYAVCGQHCGEAIVLPGETGVLDPADPFTLPNSTVSALDRISPGAPVGDLVTLFRSSLQESEESSRLFLFYCHEIGLLRGQGFPDPDTWERQQLLGMGQNAPVDSPFGLRQLSTHLLRPPAWLHMAQIQNDPWSGWLQFFLWSYSVGTPMKMRRANPEGTLMEASVSVGRSDFLRFQSQLP